MPRFSIAIDADLFSAISDEEKEKITTILKDANVLTQDGTFEGGGDVIANSQAVIADPESFFSETFNRNKRAFCKAGCDLAAASAAAACSAGTAGVALAACLAASEVANNACRDAC